MLSRLLLACVLISSACKDTPTIPGTEIPDSDENREILRVLEQYRVAFVRKDAAAVLATVHPTYYDTAGTDDPSDDLRYEDLGPVLRARMTELESIRFTVDYLEVHVAGDRASVRVWIDASFRLTPITNPTTTAVRVESRHTRKQDHAMFELVKDGKTWRISKGL